MGSETLQIDSEIGRLQTVVVHTPGDEIEAMTPQAAERLLYNEIIPLPSVLGEHRILKQVLSAVADVHELETLLAEALAAGDDARAELITGVTERMGEREALVEWLSGLSAPQLAHTVIRGVPLRRDSLDAYLSDRRYEVPPLPNLYFMRDSSFVVRDQVMVGAMAHEVRSNEALILRTVFRYAPSFGPATCTLDGVRRRAPRFSIEGGDVVVVDRNVLTVGVSERTTPAGIDALAAALGEASEEPLTILAVLLPKERRAIHLDMVFTIVDADAALVYEPLVSGWNRRRVVRIDHRPGREPVIRETEGLLQELDTLGHPFTAISCGGRDPRIRDREQWLAGANVFALAPGVIVGYDCNAATAEALSDAGFRVVDGVSLDAAGLLQERTLITIPGVNLARGGGGPRCMTLPVNRASV